MTPNMFNVLLLAVVQGFTEFLPVSSSGHLAVLGKLMGLKDDNLTVTVVLHAGTFFSILIFYFNELLTLFRRERRKILVAVIIASIPIAFVGVAVELSGIMNFFYSNFYTTGIGLCFTASVLFYAMKKQDGDMRSIDDLTLRDALLVGLAQVPALLPGISRSGSTISAGMRLKFKPEDAAWFSFLLALPAIGGASVVEPLVALHRGENLTGGLSLTILVIGFFVSMLVGLLAMKILFVSLRKRSFRGYAFYCLFLGITIIIWSALT